MPFGDSLPEMQLGSKYDAFQHRFRGIFAAIALRTIAYMDGVAVQPTLADNTRTTIEADLTRNTSADDSVHAHLKCFNSFEALECIGLEGENALINNFKGILYMARHAIAGLSSDERKMWPDNSYDYLFGSDDQISGQEHNIIHGVGYMKHITRHISSVHIPIVVQPATIDDEIPDSVFGEMADYAHAIWTCQSTRLFVPVLLIHGVQLSLVVFTRDKWRRVDFGSLAYTDNQPNANAFNILFHAICTLLYFLSLPPQKFGHFCDVSRCIWGKYEFVHRRELANLDQNSVLVDVNINDNSTDSSINIYSSNRIKRTVNMRGRFAHVFRVEKNGRDFILKLAWAPVDQLPESAVYDALKAANIPNIPLIFDSGIIIENSFGYRVEYLLIEDCGISLTKYLLTQSHWDMKWMSDNAAKPMSQIVECIYNAWNAGILHRDISASNILVKGGHIRIIDWGSATLLENSSIDIDAIETKWLFKKETDKYNKYKPDSAGTSLYKSIPVLIGATQRSIVDDIESALYVVLESVFKTRPDNLKVEPIALRLESEQSLAFVRGCCLSDVDYYRQAFGIPYCSERFAWLMDTFREYLFVRNGEYIGSKLAMQPLFERTVEIQQLERILDLIDERVFGKSPVSNTGKKQSQVGKSSTSVKAPRHSKRLQSKKRRR
ncbi:hypothetical protein GGH97_000753 [Coemansia sp. RSA 475]|nr:hypothetical protein GGH97_000753 [Coemansia sp. RSA 475]